MSETTVRSFTIARMHFKLDPKRVVRAVRGLQPEPVLEHFVVIDRRRFPPKQVISQVTGLDRADFTSHQARRILGNLGFAVGRRSARRQAQSQAGPAEDTSRDSVFEPFVGQWVAVRDNDVLVAAPHPQDIVEWLATHHQTADTMFRVPEDEAAATGIAPL